MEKGLLRAILVVAALAAVVVSVAGTSADLSAYTIGVYIDAGAERACYSAAINMFRWMGFSIRAITAADVNEGAIGDLAAVYFPGGSSPPYIRRITPEGKAGLVAAVERGAVFIGTCAGAMFAAEVQVWDGERYTDGQLGVFRGEAVGPAPEVCGPGGGVCVAELVTNGEHPVAQGAPAVFTATYYNSPFLRADPDAETHILATYRATGEPAIVAQRRGLGWVLLTGPHPEWEHALTWTFMKNALLWVLGLPIESGS